VGEFIGEANLVDGVLTGREDGVGSVDTALGPIDGILAADDMEAGSRVVCMVRPECLALGPGPANAFQAQVLSSMYLGEVEQFLLQAGGLELRAMRSNPGDEPPPTGHAVDVHVERDDVVILPADDPGAGA
jgi:ABC-type Fe3+/spermidine/putrescine transport system ATPase subunit